MSDSTTPQDSAAMSPASTGYAVAPGWEPSPGDTVRVRDWRQYTPVFGKKVADRDAVVVRCFTVLGGRGKSVTVRFGKRNGRGNEFQETLRLDDLIPWPKSDA